MKKLKDFLKTHKDFLIVGGWLFGAQMAIGIVGLLSCKIFFELEIIPFIICYCVTSLTIIPLFMYLITRTKD